MCENNFHLFDHLQRMLVSENHTEKRPSILSKTIYSFDLDSFVLHINDYDVLIFPARANMSDIPQGSIPLKRINPAATKINGMLSKTEATTPFHSIEDIFTHKKAMPNTHITNRNEKTSISVSLKTDHPIKLQKTPVLISLHLQYAVPLQRSPNDAMLLYTGAIQPSDYKGIRSMFPIGDIYKQIAVTLWREHGMIRAWFYDGSCPTVFPAEQRSNIMPRHYESLTWTRYYDVSNADRAYYFSVAAALA